MSNPEKPSTNSGLTENACKVKECFDIYISPLNRQGLTSICNEIFDQCLKPTDPKVIDAVKKCEELESFAYTQIEASGSSPEMKATNRTIVGNAYAKLTDAINNAFFFKKDPPTQNVS